MLKECGRQTLSKHFKKLWPSTLRVEGEKSSSPMKERCMVSKRKNGSIREKEREKDGAVCCCVPAM